MGEMGARHYDCKKTTPEKKWEGRRKGSEKPEGSNDFLVFTVELVARFQRIVCDSGPGLLLKVGCGESKISSG